MGFWLRLGAHPGSRLAFVALAFAVLAAWGLLGLALTSSNLNVSATILLYGLVPVSIIALLLLGALVQVLRGTREAA